MLKFSIAMSRLTVNQIALFTWAMVIFLEGTVGCGGLVPSVYWRQGNQSNNTTLSITTFYQDGTLEDCRGKGSIRGRIRTVEAYPSNSMLKLTVKDRRDKEYTIIIPGWKQSVSPVQTDWWVEVSYGFSEQSEWLRVLAQGHGQVLMYYNGNSGDINRVDPVLRCRHRHH